MKNVIFAVGFIPPLLSAADNPDILKSSGRGENKTLYFHIRYCCSMGFGDKHRAGMEDGNC